MAFSIQDFTNQIRSGLINAVKKSIFQSTSHHDIPLLQLERSATDIEELVTSKIAGVFEEFGANLKRFDLEEIEFDKESEGYRSLKSLTSDAMVAESRAKAELAKDKVGGNQDIDIEDRRERLRIERELEEEKRRLALETEYLKTHQINQSAAVAKEAASSLGTSRGNSSGAFDAGSTMAGIVVGGSMANRVVKQMDAIDNIKDADNKQHCPKCQAVVLEDSQFCGSCGEAMVTKEKIGQRPCTTCNGILDAGVKFCPQCGSPVLDTSTCKGCGETLTTDTRFCPHCGHAAA